MTVDVQIETWKREFKEKGPAKVKDDLARELYGPNTSTKVRLAEAFLAECEAEEERAHREGESDRSAKAVGLAEDANAIALRSNSISMGAAIASGVSTLIALAAFAKAMGWW